MGRIARHSSPRALELVSARRCVAPHWRTSPSRPRRVIHSAQSRAIRLASMATTPFQQFFKLVNHLALAHIDALLIFLFELVINFGRLGDLLIELINQGA